MSLISGLSRGERELIAARVSTLNECRFCSESHAQFAAAEFEDGREFVEAVCADPDAVTLPPRLSALLRIAASVLRGGPDVTGPQLAAGREAGATDREIQETVRIATAFCVYNRNTAA